MTMAEYIKREVALDAITNLAGKAPTRSAYETAWKSARALKKIPAADVAPVVHGRWGTGGGARAGSIWKRETMRRSASAAGISRKSMASLTAPTAGRRWMVWNENIQKSAGDARKLLCGNRHGKVGKDGGGEIQRLFY